MKRYLLFSGQDYYPRGGLRDFLESFDTLNAAKLAGERAINRSANFVSSESTKCREHGNPVLTYTVDADWAQILDHTTGEIIDLTPRTHFKPCCGEIVPAYPEWSKP